MPRSAASLFLAVIAIVAICTPAAAQHTLVLSGGGARGLAHAGALVAVEQLGYRPALVTGTSMGAIIGALYASGYSTDSIRTIVARENWLRLMSSRAIQVGPGREARRPLLGIGFGSGRVYGGVLSAPGIDTRLIELLFDAGVRARNDLDRLPLPYRAVAADLATGAEVVPAIADLPRIVRASMAVPGAFAPVSWGGRVLADGGVANNLPVSVARSLSSAPVIAIDVVRPSTEIENRGALDLAIRALRLLIENARPDVGSTPDYLIRPGLAPGFSEAAFPADERDALELLRLGHDAVIAQLPPAPQLEPEARRPPGAAPARIGSLRINGADRAHERLIRRIMDGAVGEYDPDRVTGGASSLYRTGLFQSVWPRLEFDEGRDPALVVDVTPVSSTSLNGAAHWNNDTEGAAWASLRQGLSLITPIELHLAGTVDVFGQDGSVDASLFSSTLPGLVWNMGANAGEYRTRVLDDGDIIALPIVRRAGGWLGAELRGPLDLNVSLLVRAERIRGTGMAAGWATGPYFRLARAPSPDRVTGIEPLIEIDLRAGDAEYQRANVRLSRSIQASRVRTAVLAAFTVADPGAPPDVFPALDNDLAPWLRAGITERSRLAVFGTDLATPILLNGHARLRLRVVARGDATSDLGDTDSWEYGGEVGAIWPTVAGPISIGAAVGRYGDWRLNVGVGPVF